MITLPLAKPPFYTIFALSFCYLLLSLCAKKKAKHTHFQLYQVYSSPLYTSFLWFPFLQRGMVPKQPFYSSFLKVKTRTTNVFALGPITAAGVCCILRVFPLCFFLWFHFFGTPGNCFSSLCFPS